MTGKDVLDWILKGASPLMVIGAIIWGANFVSESRLKQFQTIEDRVNTENHIKEGPTAADEKTAYIMDSINSDHAIKSRKKRDSIMTEILEKVKHQDSINLLNADQMFQIKEQLKQ